MSALIAGGVLRSRGARSARLSNQITRRNLGDGVRGPPVHDIPANLKCAGDFFTKRAVSYVEFKQQCISLRMFAVAGVTGGCALALFIDPPKSSYWATWSPTYLPGKLKALFWGAGGPPAFLTGKRGTDVFDVPAAAARALAGLPVECEEPPKSQGAPTPAPVAGPAVQAPAEERYKKYWPRKIMMLFGAPGAGKGTQGPKIEDELAIPQLSTGDMLRAAVAAGTEVGKKAKDIMASGGLVTDEIVIGIIADRITEPDCQTGFILDGFPRTLAQAEALDKMLAKIGERVSLVVAFDVDPAVLEERICGRWLDKKSAKSYHVKFAPPKSMKLDAQGKPIKETMLDDDTGAPLYQRADDTAEALKSRLDSYYSQTVPILDHYRPAGIVNTVDGGQPMDKVWTDVKCKLVPGAN